MTLLRSFKKNYNMVIKHQEDAKKGVFYIEVDGKQEAKMTYTFAGPKN